MNWNRFLGISMSDQKDSVKIKCSGCEKAFRLPKMPDNDKIKCPNCSGVISLKDSTKNASSGGGGSSGSGGMDDEFELGGAGTDETSGQSSSPGGPPDPGNPNNPNPNPDPNNPNNPTGQQAQAKASPQNPQQAPPQGQAGGSGAPAADAGAEEDPSGGNFMAYLGFEKKMIESIGEGYLKMGFYFGTIAIVLCSFVLAADSSILALGTVVFGVIILRIAVEVSLLVLQQE